MSQWSKRRKPEADALDPLDQALTASVGPLETFAVSGKDLVGPRVEGRAEGADLSGVVWFGHIRDELVDEYRRVVGLRYRVEATRGPPVVDGTGRPRPGAQVAELTDRMGLCAWPEVARRPTYPFRSLVVSKGALLDPDGPFGSRLPRGPTLEEGTARGLRPFRGR